MTSPKDTKDNLVDNSAGNPVESPAKNTVHATKSTDKPETDGDSLVEPMARTSLVTPEECTLYVGDLDPTTNEAHLFRVFGVYGPVHSIRVVKEALTHRSLGYAFVNYLRREDAQRALADPTPKMINNRMCRVLPFSRDAGSHRRASAPEANVFIKNLDPSIDSQALYDTFSAFGRIVSCKVAVDDFGVPKGFAYLSYDTKEAAEDAIGRMNGMLLNDRKVYVSRHIPKRERLVKMEEEKVNFTNLFVKNVDADVSEDDLSALFGEHGEIVSIALPKTPAGQHRGYGFVNFDSHDAAVRALEALDDYELKGKRLAVSRAQRRQNRDENLPWGGSAPVDTNGLGGGAAPHRPRYQAVNLYVKYLAPTVTDEELHKAFASHGTITSAKVMLDENGESRGFGFVCYSAPAEAQAAIAAMHDTELHGNKLYVALAQRRDHYGKRASAGPGGLPPYPQPQMPFLPLRAAPFAAPPPFVAPFYYPMGPPPHMSASAPNTPLMSPIPNPWAAAAAVAAASGGTQTPGTPGTPGMPRPGFASIPGSPFIPGAGGPDSRSGTPGTNGRQAGPAQTQTQNQAQVPAPVPVPVQVQIPAQIQAHAPPQQYRPTGASAAVPANGRSKHAGRRWPEDFATAGVARAEDGSSLSAAVASAANPEAENQVIGEALYPRVRAHPAINGDSALAAKITGILLDQNHDDLVRWFDVEPVLSRRIEQAYEAYQDFVRYQNEAPDGPSDSQTPPSTTESESAAKTEAN